ncbi:MAG: hypothetical protein PHD20_02810 [Clostridia bacterium]|nr:hypothetical protein [Clostridia bacterium]
MKTKKHTYIKGNNNYSLEGSDTGKPWEFEIIDKDNLLTNEITEQLKDFSEPIYFNDLSGKHWIFDFKIENVWFEATSVNCCNMYMVLNAYQ